MFKNIFSEEIKNVLQIETKRMLPLCTNGMEESTLLDLLSTSLFYNHYNHFCNNNKYKILINDVTLLNI